MKEICFDVPEIVKKDVNKVNELILEVKGLKKVIRELNDKSNKKIMSLENENAILKEKLATLKRTIQI